jgi:DNA-directed RNA polymerase specialized sigma24 family protein
MIAEPDFMYGHFDPNNERDKRESLEIVTKLVKEEFNQKHYRIFHMTFIEGYNDKELAKILNTSPASIRSVVFRIRKYLNKTKIAA